MKAVLAKIYVADILRQGGKIPPRTFVYEYVDHLIEGIPLDNKTIVFGYTSEEISLKDPSCDRVVLKNFVLEGGGEFDATLNQPFLLVPVKLSWVKEKCETNIFVQHNPATYDESHFELIMENTLV